MAILPWQIQNIKKPERFTIEDQVLSSTGNPVAFARVLISRKSSGLADDYSAVIKRDIRTDANGIFKIENLPAGDYTLQVAGNDYTSKKNVNITNANKINSNRVNSSITPAKVRAHYESLPDGNKLFSSFEILNPGKSYSTLNTPEFIFPGNVIGRGVVNATTGEISSITLISSPVFVPSTYSDPYLPGAAATATLASQTVIAPSSNKRICNYSTHSDYMASANWNPGSLPTYVWNGSSYDYMSSNTYNSINGDAAQYYSDEGDRKNYRTELNAGGTPTFYSKPYWVSIPLHPEDGVWMLATNYPSVGGIRRHVATTDNTNTPWSGVMLNKRYIVDITFFYQQDSVSPFIHKIEGYLLPEHYYQTYDPLGGIYVLWPIPGQTYNTTTKLWNSTSAAVNITNTSVKDVPFTSWILDANPYGNWHAKGPSYSGLDYVGLPWHWNECEYYTPLDLYRLKNPTIGSYVERVQRSFDHRGTAYLPFEIPAINLVGGGGTGALAEWDQEDLQYQSLIDYDGSINPGVRIKVTDGGEGYTSAPKVEIEPPQAMIGMPFKTVDDLAGDVLTHDIADSAFNTVPDSTGDYGTWNMDMDPADSAAWFNGIKDLTMSDEFMEDHGVYAGYAMTSYTEDADTGLITVVYSNAAGNVITQIGTEIELGTSKGQSDECVWPTCGTPAPGPCPITGETVGGGAASAVGAGDGLYPEGTDTLGKALTAEQVLDPLLDEKSWWEKLGWVSDMNNVNAPPSIKRAENMYQYFAYQVNYGDDYDGTKFNQAKGYLGHKMLIEARLDYFGGGFGSKFISTILLLGHNIRQSLEGKGTWSENATDVWEQGYSQVLRAPKFLWGRSKTYTEFQYTKSTTHNIVAGWDENGNYYQNLVPK